MPAFDFPKCELTKTAFHQSIDRKNFTGYADCGEVSGQQAPMIGRPGEMEHSMLSRSIVRIVELVARGGPIFACGQEEIMNGMQSTGWRMSVALMVLSASASMSGCFQTTVGGQTLPSAYYLEDDVQYFPAGPETRLYNQIQAMERYNLEREQLESSY